MQEDDAPDTTVVAKHFPLKYTKDMLLELLDSHGFSKKYDFIYLPIDFATQRSFGYAFINFITHEDAIEFLQFFNGFSSLTVCSKHAGAAEWSGSQGLEEHIERYRNSPTIHDSLPDYMKPAIYEDGERVAFPPPTKVVKVPRRVSRKPAAGAAKNRR